MRHLWPLALGATALVWPMACGGTVQDGTAVTGGGQGAAASGAQAGASFADAGVTGAGGAFSSSDAGLSDVRYVDPGCPPAAKIQGPRACDPFATDVGSECAHGDRCVPYVQYADQCKTEEIGTQCQPSGTGRQGDDCAVDDCAGGFVCVTAGTGFQCAALCQLTKAGDTCTSGLICTPLDVDGFFVCG
ncbi:MAG TPA: hypothetical protein VH062_29150 [Polyangiaceae bacterium]|nr:hypothetical protein [Polyangiaceae bacterium]